MKKILFVEDEVDQVKTLQLRLSASGYEVITASDGEEGLNKALAERPDLILMDILMPKLSGYDVCKALKENLRTKDIPIIILTASGIKELEQKCLNIGVNTIFRKPYDSKELIKAIQELITR